jgi:hypothetical protein
MTTTPTDLKAADLDVLERVRGELVLQLAETTDGDMSAIDEQLRSVEAEIDERRRADDREAAAERARRQRVIDEREAADAERRRDSLEQLRELGPQRAAATKKVDKALTALLAAVREWQRVARAQEQAANRTDAGGYAWSSEAVIAPKIAHELRTVFPHGPFQHWSYDERGKSFAELDEPYGQIHNDLGEPDS